MEIEGPSETIVRKIAKQLGLDWDRALFGDVMVVYRYQYPHLGLHDTVGSLDEVKFDDPLPNLLKP